MPYYDQEPKPVVDAVNDAIGALSDLLRTLRAQVRHRRPAAKRAARSAQRRADRGVRTVLRNGKRAVRKAREAGAAFVRGAETALRDLTHDGEARPAARTAAPRARRRSA